MSPFFISTQRKLNVSKENKEADDQVKTPGAKKLDTGALVPISANNRHILKRSDVVPVELVRSVNEDGSKGPYVEASGSDQTQAVIMSGSLTLLARSLRDNALQAKNLIEATLRVDGGEDFLIANGYLEADDSNVIDENESVLGSGSSSEEKVNSAEEKAAAKKAKKQAEADARNKAAAEAKAKAETEAKEKAAAEAKAKAEAEVKAKAEAEAKAKAEAEAEAKEKAEAEAKAKAEAEAKAKADKNSI